MPAGNWRVEFASKFASFPKCTFSHFPAQVKTAIAAQLGKESIESFEVDEYSSQVVRTRESS